MQPADNVETASESARSPRLRLIQHKNPFVALGLAVTHLMVKPAFAKQHFGDWSRIIVGQINRGHYYFAMDEKNEIQGFLGWALTARDKAEAWLTGRATLSCEDSRDGDCLIINAWTASSPEIGDLLRSAARRICQGKQAIYFKRHYKDGIIRPTRLDVNAFVEQHIERQADGAG